MRKALLIGFCCMLGALGALQIDRALRAPRTESDSTVFEPLSRAIPASAEAVEAGLPDFRAAARASTPAVVSVNAYRQQGVSPGRFVDMEVGSGSGVLISRAGHIVTNDHVLRERGELVDAVRVHFNNGKVYNAEIVGTDPRSDLAVLKIDATGLEPIKIGSSSRLEIGEWVMAIGSPLGLDSTVSVGVVSNLGREVQTGQAQFLFEAVQTDAAINPGNSGGALTNARGELVGINTAIASTGASGASIGIGFAIPIDQAKPLIDDIIRYGRARYGSLGVIFDARPGLIQVPQLRAEYVRRYGTEPPAQGIYLSNVAPGSGAARAGMRPDDVLLQIEDQKMTEPRDLIRMMRTRKPGETVRVRWWSRGEERTAQIRLEDIGGG